MGKVKVDTGGWRAEIHILTEEEKVMNITEKKDPDRLPTRQEMIDRVFKTFEEVHWNVRQAEAEWIGGDNASALSFLYDTEDVIDTLRTRIKWGID